MFPFSFYIFVSVDKEVYAFFLIIWELKFGKDSVSVIFRDWLKCMTGSPELVCVLMCDTEHLTNFLFPI